MAGEFCNSILFYGRIRKRSAISFEIQGVDNLKEIKSVFYLQNSSFLRVSNASLQQF